MNTLSSPYPKTSILHEPRSFALYPCAMWDALNEAGISEPTESQTLKMNRILRALSHLYQGWDGARRPLFRRHLKVIDHAAADCRFWLEHWPIDSARVAPLGRDIFVPVEIEPRSLVGDLVPGALYEATFHAGFISPEQIKPWAPSTPYALDAVAAIDHSFSDTSLFVVVRSGTSGDVELNWLDTSEDGRIEDGSILWQRFDGQVLPENIQLVASVRAAEIFEQGFHLAPPNIKKMSDQGSTVEYDSTIFTLTATERGFLADLR